MVIITVMLINVAVDINELHFNIYLRAATFSGPVIPICHCQPDGADAKTGTLTNSIFSPRVHEKPIAVIHIRF